MCVVLCLFDTEHEHAEIFDSVSLKIGSRKKV